MNAAVKHRPRTHSYLRLLSTADIRPLIAGLLILVSASACSSRPSRRVIEAEYSPSRLLEWISHHRRDVGLVVWTESTRPAIDLNGSVAFPLASIKKVLIAREVLAEIQLGRLAKEELVPTRNIDRYWVPGTDAGAHRRALTSWIANGDLVTKDKEKFVSLFEVVRASIKWSDNACADYLTARVGQNALAHYAETVGMRHQDPLYSVRGEIAAWSIDPSGWSRASPVERSAMAERLTDLPQQRLVNAGSLSLENQIRLSETDSQGWPLEWSQLMLSIANSKSTSDHEMRELLAWPLVENSEDWDGFARLGVKSGALPGVLTMVAYGSASAEQRPIVVVAFFRHVSIGEWRTMIDQSAQQTLLRAIVLSQSYRSQLSRALEQRRVGRHV